MEDIEVVLQRHEQQIKTLERDMTDMKTVQAEIRSMHDTLVTLATELKHGYGWWGWSISVDFVGLWDYLF